MTDDQIALRIGDMFAVLGRVRASRIALTDVQSLLGQTVPRDRLVAVLAQMGFFPGADEHYAVPEQGGAELGPSARGRVTELKVEVTIRALAERGIAEPSPEQIHEEAEQMFCGHIPPQEFIEALDRIARRPPAPLYDWRRDSSACADLGERHRLDTHQEALVEEFALFLETVGPEDFGRPV